MKLPDMNPEILAKLVFCFENDPERSDGIISGAQDSIGICMPGLVRHYYNNRFWPEKFETCSDEAVLTWLESHICMIPMDPRRPGCSVVEGKDITEVKVKALAKAADDCWNAILSRDFPAFAAAFKASFDAQVAMFPAMIQGCVQGFIDQYSGTLYLMCLEPVDTGQKSEATVPPFSVTACQRVSALIESAYQ